MVWCSFSCGLQLFSSRVGASLVLECSNLLEKPGVDAVIRWLVPGLYGDIED